MTHYKATGIVLAGGISSRMGTDKAMLSWQGRPLIQHTVDILHQVCDKVVISANHNDYAFTGCESWPDIIPRQAPMVGIYSCLSRTEDEWNVVLSCDMPLVDPGLFTLLLSKRRNYDIILPVHDNNRLEPLCAVYNKRITPELKEFIHRHEFGLHRFLRHSLHCRVSAGSEQPFYKPNMFININTSDDFDLLSLP